MIPIPAKPIFICFSIAVSRTYQGIGQGLQYPAMPRVQTVSHKSNYQPRLLAELINLFKPDAALTLRLDLACRGVPLQSAPFPQRLHGHTQDDVGRLTDLYGCIGILARPDALKEVTNVSRRCPVQRPGSLWLTLGFISTAIDCGHRV